MANKTLYRVNLKTKKMLEKTVDEKCFPPHWYNTKTEAKEQHEVSLKKYEDATEPFMKDLKELLKKHNASIEFEVSNCSDLEGIYDEKLIANINNGYEIDLANGWSIESSDIGVKNTDEKIDIIIEAIDIEFENKVVGINNQYRIKNEVIQVRGKSSTWNGLVYIELLNDKKEWTILHKIEGGANYFNKEELLNQVSTYLSSYFNNDIRV